jgi:hypothetical protein
MSQVFLVVKSSFWKPYGHLHSLINRYRMSVTDDNGYVPFAVVKGISLKIPKRSIKSVNRRTDKPMAKRKDQVNKLWYTKHYEEDQAMQTPLIIGIEIWCAGIKSFPRSWVVTGFLKLVTRWMTWAIMVFWVHLRF